VSTFPGAPTPKAPARPDRSTLAPDGDRIQPGQIPQTLDSTGRRTTIQPTGDEVHALVTRTSLGQHKPPVLDLP
jgi:hypothetical protein